MALTKVDNSLTAEIAGRISQQKLPVFPFRNEALNFFEQMGLPSSKNEEYRYTPIAKTLTAHFDLTQPSEVSSFSEDIANLLIPGLEENRIVLLNGKIDSALSSVENLKQAGVEILPLEDALKKFEKEITENFGRHAESGSDAFVAWNTAAWETGLFINVPENITVADTLTIYNLSDASASSTHNQFRSLILIDRNSEIKIVQKDSALGKHNHFTNAVSEIVVKKDARASFYFLQVNEKNAYAVNKAVIFQEDGSTVNAFTFTFDGKLIRNNLQFISGGEGCESNMYGLYLLEGDTLADNHTIADHQKANSVSNELYKGIIDGQAKGVFNGKIFVRPHAQKTNAFQSNRNILLSEKATIHTKPQLEIWADDVKCSHGCTTGQLDEEALFYLRARGIEKVMAKGMLLYAFAGEVLDKINIEAVQQFLDIIIRKRLRQND